MSKHSHPRRGSSIVTVLVLIVIVAVGIGLLWMKIYNDTHFAARRNMSQNNLKQVGLALQQFAFQHKTMPPLYASGKSAWQANRDPALAENAYSWQVLLLPYVEEATLYEAIKQTSNDFQLEPAQVQLGNPPQPLTQIYLRLLQAPSDEPRAAGTSSYVALAATRLPLLTKSAAKLGPEQRWNPAPDGLLIPSANGEGKKLRNVADGLSKTVIVCDSREAQRSNWCVGSQSFVVGFLPADSSAVPETDTEYYPYFDKNQKSQWVIKPGSTNRTALNQSPYYSSKDALDRTWGPSSTDMTPQVLHLHGDGSVDMLDDTIDPQIYFSLITISGGETVRN